MNSSFSSIRWLRILGGALAVIAISFLILMVLIAVYAFVLALQARGAPDQAAINHFAARVGPRLIPWLEMLLTLIVALSVAETVEKACVIHGLFIGILAGLLSCAVTLTCGGQLCLHKFIFFIITVGMGLLGGFVGREKGQSERQVSV